jgi:hypothetical protein
MPCDPGYIGDTTSPRQMFPEKASDNAKMGIIPRTSKTGVKSRVHK